MNSKILRLAVLPFLLLASCSTAKTSANNNGSASSSESDTASSSPSSPSSEYTPIIREPTEITLWSITGKNNQAQLQNYIDEFMKLEPNVKVNNVIQTGMNYNGLADTVIKGFTANNYPDIVQAYPDAVAQFIEYNKAVKLDDYINNETYGWSAEDKSDIISTFLEEGENYSIAGTYSLPYCKSTEALYYNEDVLLGLNLSSIDATINNGKPLSASYLNNLTWEEFFDKLCPAIVSYNDSLPEDSKIIKTNGTYSAVLGYDSDDNLFITLAEQYGIGYTSLDASGSGVYNFGIGEDKTKMETLLTKWHEYASKGYVISKGSAGNTYTNSFFNAQQTLFSVGSTGGVKYQFSSTTPMNVGVTLLPHAEGHDLKTINQGPSLAVLDHNDENRKLASWLLYKTITNKENSLDWALNSGYMGIRHSDFEDETYQEASDYTTKDSKTLDRLIALNMAYYGDRAVTDSLFTSPAFVGSAEARQQVSGIMTKVLTKTSDISEIDTWFTDAYNNCTK